MNVRRALLVVGAGIGLTVAPFVLPISWQSIPRFLHWPMLLADRPNATWLPLNAGKRVIALLFINVSGWALSLAVFWIASRALTRES